MGKNWYRLVEQAGGDRMTLLIHMTEEQAAKYPGMLELVDWEPDERLIALMKEGLLERGMPLEAEAPVGRFED